MRRRDRGVRLLDSRALELRESLLGGRVEDRERHRASLKPLSSRRPIEPIIVTVDNTNTFDAAIMEQFARQLMHKADSVRVGSAVAAASSA